MRIVFIGTVEFSKNCLEKLISINADIAGVCTKESSKFNSDFADITPLCKKNNIPYRFIEDINSSDSINWIKELNPDIIFCFGWSSLIKETLLSLSPMGILGYHPAKLPANRGRHPIIWALALGLEETASTFFFMDEGADRGDIVSQKTINISYSDDAKSLYEKVIKTALIQIEELIPMLENKTFIRKPQEHPNANYWRKRGKADGLIDFKMSSRAVYNLVRALGKPYPGAHINYNNEDIIIWKVEEIEYNKKNIESGKVLKVQNETFTVKTYDGAVKILEHEFKKIPQEGTYL